MFFIPPKSLHQDSMPDEKLKESVYSRPLLFLFLEGNIVEFM